VRGSVIDAYPYPFLNVANLGLGAALFNVFFVLVLGVILGFIFLGLDRILMRMRRA
jgi:ABC-type dipeptide/oligopeptide/nickel transport system permease subunit